MKNKWKGSAMAKFGAWIGITLSGVIFCASVVGAYAMWNAGIYEVSSQQEWRDMLYKDAANQYAIQALSQMERTEKNNWDDTYFRYGIIKAEDKDIADMDFNDESIYVERNFTEKVTADDLYMVCHQMGDVQYGSAYRTSDSFAVAMADESYPSSGFVEDIAYNIDMGIFYYMTSEELFPVKEVKLGYTTNAGRVIYTLSYDFDEAMYQTCGRKFLGVDSSAAITYVTQEIDEEAEDLSINMEEAEETEDSTEIAEHTEDTNAKADENNIYYKEADRILSQSYVTLDMLDSTDWNHSKWEYIVLDGKQYINIDSQLVLIDNFEAAGYTITTETDYKLTEDNCIELYSDEAESEESETYWIVVLLPGNVGIGWSDDLFVQANTLASFGYSLRYSIYLVGVIAFVLTLAFMVFLISAAGHRRETDEIVTTWIDEIPLDNYHVIVFAAELMLIYIISYLSYRIPIIPLLFMAVPLCLCACWIALLTLLTFAVRVKLGKWWRNTMIWRILHWLSILFHKLTENMSLFWKMALLIGVVSILEFWVICTLYYSTGTFLLVWFLEKVLFFVVLVLLVNQLQKLKLGGEQLAAGNLEHRIDTTKMYRDFKQHGENLNSIRTAITRAVDERMKSERFKTELITNVSHDIKTPLTSIINYVDLLEKEELGNETAEEYLEVLERQSARLKKLIEDLMEASKASTGNLAVNLEKLEVGVTLVQIVGEFEEKTSANGLELLIDKPQTPLYIMADSRHFWRVIDNLMNNICKYAQSGTRVYINLESNGNQAVLTFRNTSKYPLNISSEELMERFVRGDSSRNTEGSGLGLNIAKSLMELMGGMFELYVDGDLFKVSLTFDIISA